MRKLLIIKLEGDENPNLIRELSDRISLAAGQRKSVENITRVFHYDNDPFYGELEITRKMMQEMIGNFNNGIYGQDIYVNKAHLASEGAAGQITGIFLDGNKLRGEGYSVKPAGAFFYPNM